MNYDFETPNPQDQNPDEVFKTTFRLGQTEQEKRLRRETEERESSEESLSLSDEEMEDYEDHF